MERSIRDPFRDDLRRLEKYLFELESLSGKIVLLQGFLSGSQEEKTRARTEPCLACGVLPITRTGFCKDCHTEWQDHGSPDRARWIAYKTAMRNAAGDLLVTEPPIASPAVRKVSNV